ncbi:uncharacterized protein LOC136089004 [Hydra vulgaris]|uniref:Uncharacterized protein LOC136089004 n=1 Tax=Hydra vulgaris TaxID=6087 RepID=A0ABM4D849_HYDVU
MHCSLPYSKHKEHLFNSETIMDEFERMNIITKGAALDRLSQDVQKFYPGIDIPSALIKFYKNTTRRGLLCPIVIASVEDYISSLGPQVILGENVTFIDKEKVVAMGHQHNDSLDVLQLIAYYYIVDLSYARLFRGVLGLL